MSTRYAEWAWLAVTAAALAAAAWQVHRGGWRGIRLVAWLVAIGAAWALLQFASFFAVLVLGGYCENCANRPFTTKDALMYAVLASPAVIAWLLAVAGTSWWRRRRRAAAD